MKYLEIILVILATVLIHQDESAPPTVPNDDENFDALMNREKDKILGTTNDSLRAVGNKTRPSIALNYLERDVNDTVEFLKQKGKNFHVDGDKKFGNRLNTFKAKVFGIFIEKAQELRNRIGEANNSGLHVEHCNGAAQSEIYHGNNLIQSSLEKCSDAYDLMDVTDWRELEEEMMSEIRTGAEYLDLFHGMKEKCLNSVDEEECIGLQLSEAVALVTSYKESVKLLETKRRSIIALGLEGMNTCCSVHTDDFENFLSNVIYDASTCINAAVP